MINKKVFALTLIASSVIAAGCSSDDDDDGPMSGGGMVDLGDGTIDANGDGLFDEADDLNQDLVVDQADIDDFDTDGDGVLSSTELAEVGRGNGAGNGDPDPEPEMPAFVFPAFDGEGDTDSVADIIANDPTLSSLAVAVPPALLAQLDFTEEKRDALIATNAADEDDDNDDDSMIPAAINYTVFAPSDDALAAVDTAGLSGEELSNVLLGHVVQGVVTPEAVQANAGENDGAGGTPLTALNGGMIMLSNNDSGGPVINGGINFVGGTDNDDGSQSGGTQVADNGIVHVIDTVILPSEDTMTPDEGGNNETPPNMNASNLGSGVDAISANGNTEFVQIFEASGQGTVLDDQMWTIFVPTNDALDDGLTATLAADGDQANEVVRDHILTDGAFEAGDFPATLTTNGGVALTISGGEDDLTVNGFSATRIESDDTSSAIYEIDGVLQ